MNRLATVAAMTLTLALVGAVRAEDWGTVKGQVTWGGKSPFVAEVLKVDKDQDHCLSKGPLESDEFVIGKNGGVKNVFVWLTDAANPKAKLPIHPSLKEIKVKSVVMDQPCCRFEPRVIALREGQNLIGKNSSPKPHNMNWTGGVDNPGNNKLVPASAEIVIDDLKASRRPITISCNIHPWMKGWVRVFDHPYYALTDAEGKFEIKNAPAGKYNIILWHEGVGWVNSEAAGKTIEIPAGGAVEVTEKLTPSAN